MLLLYNSVFLINFYRLPCYLGIAGSIKCVRSNSVLKEILKCYMSYNLRGMQSAGGSLSSGEFR